MTGFVLFVLSLSVYLMTSPPGPWPNTTASIYAQNVGVGPLPPLTHPLYGLVTMAADRMAGAQLSAVMNGFSALCGAVGVCLMFVIVSGIRHDKSSEERSTGSSRLSAEWLSGTVAALFLTFCMPQWVVANRAHHLSFDVALLLFALGVLLRFVRDGDDRWLFGFAFIYGFGLAEFAGFITCTPLFALLLLFRWSAIRQMGPRRLVQVGLTTLPGLSVFLFWSIHYMQQPNFDLTGIGSVSEVLVLMVRNRFAEVVAHLPRVGWILIGLVSILPAIVTLAPRQSGAGMALFSRVMHVLLTALGLAIVLNLPHVSPWRWFEFERILVAPYLFIAVWFGYLAGYWQMLLYSGHLPRHPMLLSLRNLFAFFLYPSLIVLLSTAAVLNRAAADARPAVGMIQFARDVLENLEGRRWLVGPGHLQEPILLLAREEGVPLIYIDASRDPSRIELKALSELCPDPILADAALEGLPRL
ncbi:MAG: DUF2723 domain-containing protein, partial [Verrucomicrobiota bacterium]